MNIFSLILTLSGIFNDVFYWCVDLLKGWARQLGMTYEEINVWIFCVIEPIVFVVMLTIIFRQRNILRKLKINSGTLKK